MSSNIKEQPKEIGQLADDARALMEATAHLTGQKVQEARKRLAIALKNGKVTGDGLADESVDLAADNIEKLCDHITVALNHGKEIYDKVHDDVVDQTKAADHTVREHPYRTIGIALGVGTILGYIIASRHSRGKHYMLAGNSYEQL